MARLVKELRLAGISAIAQAGLFLEKTYLPKMNRKFSRPPAEKEDAHAPLGNTDLKNRVVRKPPGLPNKSNIMCLEYERAAGNGYVVRFENRLYQILKSNKKLPRPGDKVIIRIRLDGFLTIIWKETKLLVKELANTERQKIRDVA